MKEYSYITKCHKLHGARSAAGVNFNTFPVFRITMMIYSLLSYYSHEMIREQLVFGWAGFYASYYMNECNNMY